MGLLQTGGGLTLGREGRVSFLPLNQTTRITTTTTENPMKTNNNKTLPHILAALLATGCPAGAYTTLTTLTRQLHPEEKQTMDLLPEITVQKGDYIHLRSPQELQEYKASRKARSQALAAPASVPSIKEMLESTPNLVTAIQEEVAARLSDPNWMPSNKSEAMMAQCERMGIPYTDVPLVQMDHSDMVEDAFDRTPGQVVPDFEALAAVTEPLKPWEVVIPAHVVADETGYPLTGVTYGIHLSWKNEAGTLVEYLCESPFPVARLRTILGCSFFPEVSGDGALGDVTVRSIRKTKSLPPVVFHRQGMKMYEVGA